MLVETIKIDPKLKGGFAVTVIPQPHDRVCSEYMDAGPYGGLCHCKQGNTQKNTNKLINAMIDRAEEHIEECVRAIKELNKLKDEING